MKPETIILELDDDVQIQIEYEHIDYEPPVFYDLNMTGSPGEDEDVEIKKIFAPEGEDVYNLINALGMVAYLEEKVLEKIIE